VAQRRVSAERQPLYARLADITVDVAAELAATCDRVVEALRAQGAAGEALEHDPQGERPE